MKTTKNTGEIQKTGRKVREECRNPLNHKLFSENFLYDPLDVVISQPIKLSIF